MQCYKYSSDEIPDVKEEKSVSLLYYTDNNKPYTSILLNIYSILYYVTITMCLNRSTRLCPSCATMSRT
jgi:hypothetical protein